MADNNTQPTITTSPNTELDLLLESSLEEQNKLNQELNLVIPENEGQDEQNKKYWNSFFRLLRTMYVEEMIEVNDTQAYIESFSRAKDKQTYLSALTKQALAKMEQNKILRQLFNYESLVEKLKQALEVVPAEYAAQFIGEIFNENPPQELLDELGIKVELPPEFTQEEIEILQQGRIQDILKQKPLNAKNIATSPGFNKPFSPEDIGQIVDQFGQNYNQAQLQKQAAQRAKANQPYIPGRYQVNQPQTANVGTILEPIEAPAFPRKSTPAPQNYSQPPTQFATSNVRAVAAKKISPAINPNFNLQRNPAYPPNSQPSSQVRPMSQMPPQMVNRQQPGGFPQQNSQRPIPVGNSSPRAINNNYPNNAPRMSVANPGNIKPGNNGDQAQNGLNSVSSLPHKEEHGLADLLGRK